MVGLSYHKMKAKLFLLLLLLAFQSCDYIMQNESGKEDVSETIEPAEKKEFVWASLLITNVDQLRLRRYCDVKSEMLTTFDENALLLATGEQTDFEETISGSKGPWLKVKTVDEVHEGWVFGGEKFVSEWLSGSDKEEIERNGRSIMVISNASRTDMNAVTGANFDADQRGSRYSGYYEVSPASPEVIDGSVVVRARHFNSDSKKVEFAKCTFEVEKGMPSTEITCVPVLGL